MYHSVLKRADPKLLTGKQLEAYEMVREHFESKTHRSALKMIVSGTAGTIWFSASSFSWEIAYVLRLQLVWQLLYKAIWTPEIYEILRLQREVGNGHDEHAVAVLKASTVVGHVPRSISRICWFFLRRGGQIICRITGHRRFGNGLEVPCVYISEAVTVETSPS